MYIKMVAENKNSMIEMSIVKKKKVSGSIGSVGRKLKKRFRKSGIGL